MKNLDLEALESMQHSRMLNYILPGLESHLLGATTRVFRNTRHSLSKIVPHSHRYDFQCLVLQGSVTNTLFIGTPGGGDLYQEFEATYGDSPGVYSKRPVEKARYIAEHNHYGAGEWYGMTCDQIHSIEFSRDAVVLFIEGAPRSDKSIYIEPVVEGETIHLLSNEPWMFRKK